MELEIKATDIVEQIVVSTKREFIIKFGKRGFEERNNSKMMDHRKENDNE
jgi:hypothetical protein